MRLLIATPLYPPDLGGPATYTKLLEDGMPFPVVVVPFSRVRSFPKIMRHVAYAWQVWRELKKGDVVLALDPVSVGLPALWAARFRSIPFFVKIVGDYAWEQGVQRFGITDSLDQFVQRKRVPFQVQMLRRIQAYVARSSRRVIVPSEYLKRIIRAWRIAPERISVIYNSIELEATGTAPEGMNSLARPIIATSARLVPWKGIDGLMRAMKAIPNASLVVIGDGPERLTLERQAEADLPGRHLFTGALTHADALAVMERADIFVLNSTYEGLSHVLIEALMLGKPVVATDVGGNGELIQDGNGLLVPPSDDAALIRAIQTVLADQVLRKGFEANAIRARKTFSAERMRENTAELLSI